MTALGAQSQLWDVAHNRFSSLVRGRGWDRLFAPPARAWEPVGALAPAFRGQGTEFRGAGRVLAGVHDSNANYLRYLAAGIEPDPPWSKEVLLDYLAQCRRKLRATIEALTAERAHARTRFYWGDPSGFEKLLYTLRHVQHHAGQLSLLLRQTVDSAPRYVFRAREDA